MSAKAQNQIPPWNRIAVDATTAAQMLSCSRSTFFQRVKDGIYPKPGRDGQWSVAALRQLHPAGTAANEPNARESQAAA